MVPAEQLQCFGISWEARDPKCAGGHDATFIDMNGKQERTRCPYYSVCAAKTSAAKLETRRSLPVVPQTPTQQVQNRIPQPLAPAPMHTVFGPAVQQQPIQYAQQQQQQPMVPASYTYPSMAAQPQMVPMNYTPPAYQMPGYLTVPEPMMEGQHWGARLGLTLVRAILKAAGHTAANFFDHTTFNEFAPPPQQQL